MATNDIYNSEHAYQRTIQHIDLFALNPKDRKKKKEQLGLSTRGGNSRYYCINPQNMQYFPILFKHFDKKDLSYIRRLRLINAFKFIISNTPKYLADIETKDDREAIDDISIAARKTFNPESYSSFIADIKSLWKAIHPAKDEKGRTDETQTPYVVRHLSGKTDKSRQKTREDRLTQEEYAKLLNACSDDIRLQAFVAIAYESLGRPQELLTRRIKDVELFDNYAKITISDHGKEGIGLLRVIAARKYLAQLLEWHPLKYDKNAYLFINTGRTHKYDHMRPENIRKLLAARCATVHIDKPITAYSFKRNGVSDLRLNGTPDKEIQARARWTTTKQLTVYDITGQQEAFNAELVRLGIKKGGANTKQLAPLTRQCLFCDFVNPSTNRVCDNCSRMLYREDIEADERRKDQQMADLQKQLDKLNNPLTFMAELLENPEVRAAISKIVNTKKTK